MIKMIRENTFHGESCMTVYYESGYERVFHECDVLPMSVVNFMLRPDCITEVRYVQGKYSRDDIRKDTVYR